MNDDVAELLDVVPPTAVGRKDASLVARGVRAEDLASAKAALVAVALGDAEAAAPSSAMRDRLLASVTRGGRYGVFADKVARIFDLELSVATALVEKLEDESAWMPFIVDGVQMIPVEAGPKHANAIATFVRIAPGSTFPDHTHRGNETMFVLDGGFREVAEGGAEIWRGDELYKDDGTDHELVALPGRPCVAASLVTGHADFR